MINNSNFSGITDNNKPSSKVLRPPGGGTSDIFGGDLPQTPRNVKNHMQSNIFSCDKNGAIKNNGDQPRRGQQKGDSYQRLFGEPERPMTPAKNHMKSNIPFGSNTEAAQELLANGNGHHSNGKGGSVSTSTSSSVSSSTENLKMMNGVSKTEPDEACPPPPTPESSSTHNSNTPQLSIDLPCEDKSAEKRDSHNLSARSRMSARDGDLSAHSRTAEHADPTTARSKVSANDHRFTSTGKHCNMGAGDVASQTYRNAATAANNPHSFSNMSPASKGKELLEHCDDRAPPVPTPRNPITGLGLGEDGVGGIKPKKPKDRRDGNPVTGEGYKGSNSFNNSIPSLNGANQVINKNRIPPGGFSSGLW